MVVVLEVDVHIDYEVPVVGSFLVVDILEVDVLGVGGHIGCEVPVVVGSFLVVDILEVDVLEVDVHIEVLEVDIVLEVGGHIVYDVEVVGSFLVVDILEVDKLVVVRMVLALDLASKVLHLGLDLLELERGIEPVAVVRSLAYQAFGRLPVEQNSYFVDFVSDVLDFLPKPQLLS